MPHPTLKQAEEAAINGEVPEWDTQNCEDFQKALLSSPAEAANTPEQVASANLDAIIDALNVKVEVETEQQTDNDAGEHHDTGNESFQLIQDPLPQQPEPQPELEQEEAPQDDATTQAAPIEFRRDSKGKLRAYTIGGGERRPAQFEERYRAAIAETQRTAAMEDFTQKSSMSLTQENSESAYAEFDIKKAIHDECPSTATPDDGVENDTIPNPPHESIHSKQFSARTESTAFTYGENDTGHVKIDFEPDPVEEELDDMDDMDDEPSQDPPFAAPQLGLHYSAPTYDPQTPAAPINPFAHKGSVMKPLDMFGATQPSSVARHRASPTSSRPSPDVYYDFSSPPKRQRIGSSPLGRLRDSNDLETSPLQNSVRDLLVGSSDFPDATLPRTSGVQSFDVGPRSSRVDMHEPRPYVSMKESQERRRRMHEESDTGGSDFEGESLPRNKKREREIRIQREMSSVAFPTKRPTSSHQDSSNSPGIEVPSTGRRRSVQDDYLVQCEGLDARDTQQTTQDDIIADSQGLPSTLGRGILAGTAAESEPDIRISNTSSRTRDKEEDPNSTPQVDPQPKEDEPTASTDVDHQTQPQTTNESSLPEPSLPLQEMSSNHLRTPMASKSQVMSDGLVPETSPPEERMRPMGEIASISFKEAQVDMIDVPGFTQDDFDKSIGILSPPKQPRRQKSFRSSPVSRLDPVASSPSDVLSTAPGNGQPSLGKTAPLAGPVPGTSTVSDNGLVQEKTTVPDSAGNPLPENDVVPRESPTLAPTFPILQAPQEHSEEVSATIDAPIDAEVGEDTGSGKIPTEAPSKVQEEEKPVNGEVPGDVQDTNLPTENSLAEDVTQDLPGPSTKRSGLRTKSELKGPSRSLRHSNSKPASTPRVNLRVTKTKAAAASKASAASTPASIPKSIPDAGPSERAATRSQAKSDPSTPAPAPNTKRTAKRKSGVIVVDNPILPTRASKRQSTANVRDESEDPLALTPVSVDKSGRSKTVLFESMAFAVSYVKNEQEKDDVTKLIVENGGRILQDGFDVMFNAIPKSASEDIELSLSESANSFGFTALIADEHSRKAKYMQALALGLPCISGRWISACVVKMSVVDWTPYLLCAGQSSFLGNAFRSRTIKTYSASDAKLADIFSSRDKLLEGKSVLLVTGKGHSQEKRKAYLFLTRALGPARVGQVVDYQEARKKLAEADASNESYDILYVEGSETTADKVVFGAALPSGGSKKRKRGPAEADADLPAPKKIRIIVDETMVQSLILSQLLLEG